MSINLEEYLRNRQAALHQYQIRCACRNKIVPEKSNLLKTKIARKLNEKCILKNLKVKIFAETRNLKYCDKNNFI
jgi:hypothetical protein